MLENKQIKRFEGHPFDSFSKNEPVDFDKLHHDYEKCIHL